MDEDNVVVVMPPQRKWGLRQLTAEEYEFWEEHGYVAVARCVPPEVCAAAASAIREFVGASSDRDISWYQNELDIYEDWIGGKRPKHGPCGMVQMFHHASLWEIRQHPSVHGAFADVYGTPELWVTTDRAHFKPPEDPRFPKWANAGPVHTGLHWDVAVEEKALPVPFAAQGVLYLEKTNADQGALRVVPGSRHRLRELRDRRERLGSLAFDSVAVEGDAGTLVLWHSATLHGPGRNVGSAPRVSAYVAMLPVDATAFNGGRRADYPLSLADAGTLRYDDDGDAARTLRRVDCEGRVRRWRRRLPHLEEDPREQEVERYPPGEPAGAPPFGGLTPLGRKLVGLDPW
ncbi:hypothetical protein CTAYLR_001046 [Chrysophaeum taylorii]|uniref:Phytanoyl-CoA dioxygenase n=1 Tax=Chrysophaeum taylorii TaxID=2483200 RepID=A0AAD7UFP0_9STRA|nr:hypothetical protein CTAYLR_001046 [Chrysophaeum taylorii]